MTWSSLSLQQRRAVMLAAGVIATALLAMLIGAAFRDNLVFFYTPTELHQQKPSTRTLRLGGMVAKGSVVTGADPLDVTFAVDDGQHRVKVEYHGLLPDLFREGQGIVAEGVLEPSGHFRAKTILAKHDETYMPPDVGGRRSDFRSQSLKSLQQS